MHGKGKSGSKFQAIRKQIMVALPTAPPPGPSTFVVNCLQALLLVEPPFDEGLSHLLISALGQLDPSKRPAYDAVVARGLAASLFYKAVARNVHLEPRIMVKLPVVFDFQLKDVGGAMSFQELGDESKTSVARALIESCVVDLIKTRSYKSAVTLLQQFNLQKCDSQDFVITMATDGHADLAGQWAAYLGKDMLKFLVHRCTEMGEFKIAYKVVQCYKLEEDFPDAYHLYRQSSIRKLVSKGLWDIAVSIAEEDPQLVDYLLTLALEDGDAVKIAEICERFKLDHVPLSLATEPGCWNNDNHFMQLDSLISVENIHWIDSPEGLSFAARYLSGVTIVGIDCEWKADRIKGFGRNKVSILQVASSERVFIFDLITLSKENQCALNSCIKAVFHAPNIIKLGYAVHNDLERLVHSYQEIECFRTCESVLDLQKVAGKRTKGGLSGLAKSVLGRYLDKKTRFSDWEGRPLSQRQLHYAALDAVVLLPIYDHMSSVPSISKSDGWKSPLMSFRVTSKFKKQYDADAMSCQTAMDLPISVCASHEDLVSASCELVGLPIPGLLKSELLEITQAAQLPPPVYKATCIGPLSAVIYHCTVKVAGTTFSGCPAFTKKDAESSAAKVALTNLDGDAYITKQNRKASCSYSLRPKTLYCPSSAYVHFLPKRYLSSIIARMVQRGVYFNVYSKI